MISNTKIALIFLLLSASYILTNVELYQTTVMPGFVLEQSKLASLTYNYNASTLAEDFPNLDLYSDDVGNGTMAGADTVTMSFLLTGTTSTGAQAYQARQVLLQGSRLLGLDNEAGTTATATMSFYLRFTTLEILIE